VAVLLEADQLTLLPLVIVSVVVAYVATAHLGGPPPGEAKEDDHVPPPP
jgi:hypothetical protein